MGLRQKESHALLTRTTESKDVQLGQKYYKIYFGLHNSVYV